MCGRDQDRLTTASGSELWRKSYVHTGSALYESQTCWYFTGHDSGSIKKIGNVDHSANNVPAVLHMYSQRCVYLGIGFKTLKKDHKLIVQNGERTKREKGTKRTE
jgi:hypothetical protein